MPLRGAAEEGVLGARSHGRALLMGMFASLVTIRCLHPMSEASLPVSSHEVEPSADSALLAWMEGLGLRFDPFGPLDAASDPRLFAYLVQHEAFERIWGDWPSWAFAPPGGGKTALRVRTAQACWVGQETNHPFPISYVLPFLAWGHASPTLDDHLAALARAGAMTLLVALAYHPHWFFQLDERARRDVRQTLDWNLPGPLSSFLEPCRQAQSPQPLCELDPTFTPLGPPEAATLLRWCDALDAIPAGGPRPSPAARWDGLCRVLLETLGFRSVYVLADGLDAAPETAADVQRMVECLSPLLPLADDRVGRRIFLKGFLPLEAQSPLADRFPGLFAPAHTVEILWEPDLLAEVIRRRVYVASGGAFGSLDAVSSPAVRDVETMLAKAVLPLPREILVLTRRVLEEHVRREGNDGIIREEDIDAAIQWYNAHKPQIALGEAIH